MHSRTALQLAVAAGLLQHCADAGRTVKPPVEKAEQATRAAAKASGAPIDACPKGQGGSDGSSYFGLRDDTLRVRGEAQASRFAQGRVPDRVRQVRLRFAKGDDILLEGLERDSFGWGGGRIHIDIPRSTLDGRDKSLQAVILDFGDRRRCTAAAPSDPAPIDPCDDCRVRRVPQTKTLKFGDQFVSNFQVPEDFQYPVQGVVLNVGMVEMEGCAAYQKEFAGKFGPEEGMSISDEFERPKDCKMSSAQLTYWYESTDTKKLTKNVEDLEYQN